MKNDNPQVNDGRGFYDNVGLCDTLINDLNNLLKEAVSGQFIKCSSIVVSMVQKLINLKKGFSDELKDKDRIIEELKEINHTLVEEKTGIPVERDGLQNGND